MNSAVAMRGQNGTLKSACTTSRGSIPRCMPAPRARQLHRPSVATSAASESKSGDTNFLAGFVVGGVVFGALGFLFAPQISKSLLGDDQRLRLPRFMEEETKDPEQTKQDLTDKIAKLNASIDEVAGKLKDNDKVEFQPQQQ
ncbi:hypothetical protein DUNSADRAFT_1088 [Dunaliella salina]|uniref:Uncharacterized protein n=1 Tax=Dunaliella salina TaxID=3046 RepID=A0ABQ7GXI9_DUNSA|nr:hypothetical protein DUNSADRAFT_1088 [Dunaliella salina]|eukprot:KAF5839311.1 hypothetical protein DUNSADRAFT_1088 [Dunaliella salina]